MYEDYIGVENPDGLYIDYWFLDHAHTTISFFGDPDYWWFFFMLA